MPAMTSMPAVHIALAYNNEAFHFHERTKTLLP